ncbi:MAG: hypothetical protein A3D31_10235 [Candidatus Fluviicola riflensis]|nr:MAG: hypothetical protein CHH17_14650 [Candidatus Fluviicola riflensis]OGS77381.1 MAG: hypothetical protein A3D31_10235 [Candidatus Fluviicola riflensis]OGS83961.1 MAG: hypothetical protein A3E30_11635 [Fluviicola sp. RIFCSPHIGHO2_12_FULL_43_24]OGS84448.1 MAG: hypothetical protein A2724_07175 [Fluviicola sp. RIFCSPHIGHO2_01_FULL_43_53]
MKQVLVSFVICCCLNFTIQAQETVVIGTVLNADQQPIEDASVQLGQFFSSTDRRGQFKIIANYLPVQLLINHPFYELYEQIVLQQTGKDTIFLAITLITESTDLEEVTVNADKIVWAYPEKSIHIIDFDLRDYGMLLLCSAEKQCFLRLVDDNNKTLFDQPVRKNPLSFFHDCLDGIHLLYQDSVVELMVLYDTLFLLPPASIGEFKQSLEPCALSKDKYVVFKQLGPHNKALDYTLVNRINQENRLLYQAADTKQIKSLDAYAAENDIPAIAMLKANTSQQLSDDRKKWQNARHYEQNLIKPLYIPIVTVNDTTIIFDHFKDSMTVFSADFSINRRSAISYHYFDFWQNKLLVNEEHTRVFAKYEDRGLVKLREIDPHTGSVIGVVQLDKHVYPASIQIKGRFVYYLFHRYVDDSINYVYKQRID